MAYPSFLNFTGVMKQLWALSVNVSGRMPRGTGKWVCCYVCTHDTNEDVVSSNGPLTRLCHHLINMKLVVPLSACCFYVVWLSSFQIDDEFSECDTKHIQTSISFYLNLTERMVQRIECSIFRILFENGVGCFTKNLLYILVTEILARKSDCEGLLLKGMMKNLYKENCNSLSRHFVLSLCLVSCIFSKKISKYFIN